MTLDDAIDEVFSQPLDRFTEERNRIVRELASDGKKDDAAALKALKKPSVSAWAVNQLVRRDPDAVAELVQLHEELTETRGGPDLRRITGERRRLIARLTEETAALLAEAGHPASSATLQRVGQTLLAASSGGDLEALARGRLTSDLEAPGFGALSDFEAAGAGAPFQGEDRRARDKAEELGRRAVEAEAEAAELRSATERAAEELGRLEKRAEAAARRAEKARAAADAALEGLS